MKRIILYLLFLIGTITVSAESYPYLTFEMSDGATVSVSSSSLTITISDTTITAGDQSFVISNLSKMYFSTSDKTSGIDNILISDLDQVVEIYDLNGRKVDANNLKKGVYIVKSKNGSYKIAVK